MMDKEQFLREVKHLQVGSFELVDDEHLLIICICGSHYKIYDNGQRCCEKRWMTCDDDLSMFQGCTISDIEILDYKESDDEDECGDVEDIQFLRIMTNLGDFRICMHNNHNGYYGGFDPVFEKLK